MDEPKTYHHDRALGIIGNCSRADCPDCDTSGGNRPAWDQIWMEMALLLSRRSVDPRTKVGAVIVSDDNTRVLAVGYNGNHKGGPNQVDSEEPGMSGFIHGEENALIKTDYNLPCRKIMYVSLSPCQMCAKKIINASIDEVVYNEEYRDTAGLDILRSAGVGVRQYTV